ncbi:uncharacterized protein LOC100879028 isoform X1 [Megachile rotundata]|uniref:uncharacterized protein LOC100879028 isoform X1 n=1 Tax=Megachile rotundata TaxID=143995 RepID=UPI003FD0B683
MNNMCDLIDLESPDRKSILNSRLASPLIPAPTDITNNDHNNLIKDPIPLIPGKRDSLENNPFDMVLHKTTEYIQKRDDPFEVALEKALRPKCKKDNKVRTHSFDFTDDYSVKHSNNKQKLKVNKTLDESLIYEELTEKAATVNKISNESVIPNLTNINGFHDNLETNDVICSINVQDADLSILNQSLMNDSLFETSNELNKNEMALTLYEKAAIQVEKDKLSIGQSASPNYMLKVPKVQRSLSQGGNEPFKKSQNSRCISLAEPLQINSDGGSNISSLNSLDFLNEGFLKSYCSGSSMFSNLSNISCIPRINSAASSSTTLSILSSNDTINRAFLKSETSEKLENSKLSVEIDFNNKIKLITNESTKCILPELTIQFDKLKKKVLESPENFKQQSNEKSDKDNKLIDVDLFTPEINSSKNNYRSSTSDTSSDSVFYEGDKVNKSIFTEAKLLAKTFEELALKTSSSSSTDDLITNNPLWTSELLPAFDDENMVDNLIELPSSPHINSSELTNMKDKEYTDNKIGTEKDAEIAVNKITENVKELELELTESVQTEKRITATTLLLELKKLIKTENNSEANKLVENLEKVLGINCENNTELLTTYLNTPNNLAKSPQKSDNSSKVIQNIEKNNMEQSQEDNLTNDSDNVKESLDYKNINFNDSDINKCTDSQKCLNGISNESLKTNIEKAKKERNEKVLNNEIVRNENSLEDGSKSLLHEKVVVELLANIAKLLTSQTERSTSDVLKNLGKVLNSASNDDDKHKRTKNDGGKIPSKSINRRSLDADSKKQSFHKNVIRRSMSVSSTKDTIPATCNNKSACQLKEVIKRFPSDPCLVNPISNKKVITKINKDGLQKDTETEAFTTLDLRKEKTATISTVKNKLKKKKTDVEVTNKKGPMRAVLPVGIMQKKETVNNKAVSSYETVTPPKSHKIISSTPNSTHNESAMKKSSRSTKPVASSTPDAQNFKSQKTQVQVTKKRNFSCDISPVSIRANVDDNNKINSSPKRKLPSPKKTTPKRRSIGSGIPKSQTPPLSKRLNTSFDINQYNKLYESPQRSSYKTLNSQKGSPISVKKNGSMQQSPLRDNNKLIYKAKPVNLISKLQRHSVGNNMAEKENYI